MAPTHQLMDAKEYMADIQPNGLVPDILVNILDIQDNLLDIQVNSLDIQVNSLEDHQCMAHQLDMVLHQEATIYQEQWTTLEHQTLLKPLELRMQIRKRTERFDRLLNFKYIQLR